MFGRRRNDDESDELDLTEAGDEEGAADAAPGTPPARPAGPWDEQDAPEDGIDRVDLGGLLVPVVGGHELRVDVEPETGQIVSVTLATPTSAMQVAAFAAPRTAGIWGEVREEIVASLATGGGATTEATGPYGTELHAQVPTDVPGQLAPARFVGVDGPRWFLRAMLQGRAATELDADPGLLDAFGQVVVRRGLDAMVVRDALPMRLPPDLAPPQPEPEPEQPSLALPERGPELTETS